MAQRDQYATIGQPRFHPDFDRDRLAEAQEWLSNFLSSNRGVDSSGGSKFQASHVKASYQRLHLCAAGVDGLNKRWLLPAATLLLQLSFRSFMLRVRLLSTGVEYCSEYPENQQGFIKGGRIYASLLSLYAIVEAARLQRRKLFVTFVDVRKAFPLARRELLLHIFAQKAASDELVRATWALCYDAKASVRGSEGYGLPFPIDVGTREGGAESPHLYIIFICNIIATLNAVALRDGGALLSGTACRALQLADDLAIIS